MRKKNLFRNSPLYLLALLNVIYTIQHGISWLHIVTFILVTIVALFDIWEVLRNDFNPRPPGGGRH